MARKKEAKVEVVNEVAISKTLVLVTYSDGTSEIRFKLTSDELEKLVAAVSPADEEEEEDEEDEEDEEEEEEEEDEDEEDDDEEDDDEEDEEDDDEEDEEDEAAAPSPEELAGMDFEELEDVCDDHSLDVDPDDYEEEDIEKFRKAIAKELGITLPKAKKETKAKGKKGKK
jgi:flagellar biosynthesis component FlhA